MAGQSAETVERMQVLEECRITPDMEIEQPEYLFRMHGKDCFPRGELVGVQGKMKSGKTFFCSMLMALCMKREVLSMTRNRPTGLRLMWIDTEQSRMSTQKILKNRLRQMIGAEHLPMEQLEVFNLRARSWQERLPLVETAVKRFRPELVVFDGIRDCVDDINDYQLANDVITRLTQIASGHTPSEGDKEQEQWPPCCIVCVLHENKSDDDKSLRGALGTELGNKDWELFEVTKDSDTMIFSISQRATREIDIHEPLKFFVNEKGLPEVLNAQNEWRYLDMMQQSMQPQPQKEAFKNEDGAWNLVEIFEHLLGRSLVRSKRLGEALRATLKVGGENASSIIKEAVAANVIYKDVRNPHEVYYGLSSLRQDIPQEGTLNMTGRENSSFRPT